MRRRMTEALAMLGIIGVAVVLMGATSTWYTTRLNDATDATTIDNHIVDLETAIVTMFGLPVHSDTVTNMPLMDLDTSGRVTNLVRFHGDGGSGLRLRDPNDASEVAIDYDGGLLTIYKNDGSEASPTWTAAGEFDPDTGFWVNNAHAVINLDGNQTVNATTVTVVLWDDETLDPGTLHDPSDPNNLVTIPAGGGGVYRIDVNICWLESDAAWMHYAILEKNGLPIITPGPMGASWPGDSTGEGTFYASTSFSWLESLVATDYLRVKVYHTSASTAVLDEDYTYALIQRIQ